MNKPQTSATAGMAFALITVAIDAAGIGIILPIMPELLLSLGLHDIGEAALWGGVLATVYALMQFLFAPILGSLSDTYGRRPVLLLSLAAMVLDYLFLTIAGSLWLLVLGRVIAGICGATHSTATAYVADISEPGERAKRFGLLGAMFGLGFVFGPALGGVVGEWHVRAPFVVAALLAAGNLVFGYFYLQESLAEENRRAFSLRHANPFSALKRAFKLPRLNTLLLGYLIFALGNHVYPVIWSYWGKATFNWSAQTIGLSIAAYGVAMAISQGVLMHRFVSRFGEAKTAIIGICTGVFGAMCFGFVNATWMVFVLMPFAALSEFSVPALSAIMANRVGNDEQGELQGLLGSLMAVTNIIAPAIYTSLFYAFSSANAPVWLPGAPFILGSLLIASVIPIIWRSLHRE